MLEGRAFQLDLRAAELLEKPRGVIRGRRPFLEVFADAPLFLDEIVRTRHDFIHPAQ